MKKSTVFTVLFLLTLFVGSFAAGRVQAAQPHMTSALRHLRAARQELELATAGKGGHRERAMRLVGDAIAEVEAGIDYARTH